MKKHFQKTLLVIITIFSPYLNAETLWADYALNFNHGNGYLNPFANEEYSAEFITLERASGHDWGSTYSFLDVLFNASDDSPTDIYGETGAKYTLAKFDNSVVKNIHLGGQIEHGYKYTSMTNYLAGVGVDLNIPGASFFSLTAYKRNNDPLDINKQNNEQITSSWRFDWQNFRFGGFCDLVSSAKIAHGADKSASQVHCRPFLTYDVSKPFNLEPKTLDAGIKYIYWKNKFGVNGMTEKNVNLLINYHF